MELTIKQQIGLKIALERYFHGEKYTTIAGFAGTGKSTLVRFIIDALDINENLVAYAAFTGKAAEVLRKKGNQNAITLHRLLFDSVPKKEGGFLRIPKKQLEYKVIVVDEVSMVPKAMIDMLLGHNNIYVIFLGDPFQLPQIDKNDTHDLLDNPHIFLDEVMRQAQESEIIRLTMAIREGKDIPFSKGEEAIVIPKKDLVTGHLLWADQVICGTNATRIGINNQMRELLGFSGLPQSGEKFLCLRNYWSDIGEDEESSLVNGMTGTIINPFESFQTVPYFVKIKNHKIETIICDFKTDDGVLFKNINMDRTMIETGNKCVDWKDAYILGKMKHKIGDIIPREFTYGYAITGHKAQGCQWEKVTVIEEQFPFSKTEHARWLYTCCTRPEKKLVLVR